MKAHHRLVHQFRQRIRWAPYISVFVGAGTVLLEGIGYRRAGPFAEPQPFREIWWHVFVVAGIMFVFFMLWPDPEKSHHRN